MWKRVKLKKNYLKKLKCLSKKISIDFICSFFDLESLNLAKKIGVDAYKVASSDINDEYLLSHLKTVNKPIIISTGMASLKDIKNAVKILKNKKICILHCVSMYPCPLNFANLKRISALKQKFKVPIGYSDHCKGIQASQQAIFLESLVVEKHFTIDKNQKGADHELSADYHDLKQIVDFANNFKSYLGQGKIEPSKKEINYRKFFRKSLYFNKSLKKNKIITLKDIIIKRPRSYFDPKNLKKIIGKKIVKNVKKYDPITPSTIK